MFFIKKRVKIEIPSDLRIKLRELQTQKNKQPSIRYSLSLSDEELEKAKTKIKSTEVKPTFNELLFKYIDKTKLTDSQVYKKAHVDRRTFSKIRNDKNYHPSKETIICLGFALQLSIEELERLLNSAYYSLPENSYFNIAIKYCIENKIYDLEQVNDILYACNLPILKGKY